MDAVLEILDPQFLDSFYSPFPAFDQRDWWVRQYFSILLIWIAGGWLFYLVFAGLSWYFLFDKSLREHKLFLPKQEWLEIQVAMESIPWMAVPSAFIFLAEVNGYSKLYGDFPLTKEHLLYNFFMIIWFLVFTDMLIYWIHRWLHHPLLYGPIHKLHHKWIISTPFAR